MIDLPESSSSFIGGLPFCPMVVAMLFEHQPMIRARRPQRCKCT